MKKLLTYIVLILFIYNLAGYYIVFKGWQSGIRKEIRSQIRNNLNLSEIEVLTFSKADLIQNKVILEWEKDKEFRFNDNMYDVVSRRETTDSITFICINDRKEKNLIDQFQAHVSQQHENAMSKRPNPFKILEKLFNDYCSDQPDIQNYRDGITIYKPQICVSIPGTFLDVLSPPPKVFV